MTEKIRVCDALDRIESHIRPLQPRMIRLDAIAHGQVLAKTVTAIADTPRFDCSAMDGFAIASAETLGATELSMAQFDLAPDIPASNSPGALPSHAAAPISTGAPIPQGADAVVAKERCRVAEGRLFVSEPVSMGRNIRRRGEDMPVGTPVAGQGTILSPVLIGALLAYGVSRVEARQLPKVAILSTGSEFTTSNNLGAPQRIDSNGPMIGAMCRSLGLEIEVSDPVPDDREKLGQTLDATRMSPQADLILSTGGVSVGSHDLVREALERVGARIIFHGIAMRPGKPILFAVLPDGRPYFGLPGNPVAALVGFRFFVMAAIRRQLGLDRELGRTVQVAQAGRDGVTQFLRARMDDHGEIILAEDQRSHVMRSLLDSNCWVCLDAADHVSTASLFPHLPP